jgi:hypothetical protein
VGLRLQRKWCGVTPRRAVASVYVCCMLQVLKQHHWPCEQVFHGACQVLIEHAAAQPAGAAACEGCSQAAQALVVMLRKSIMRLGVALTDRSYLTHESVAMVCAVPPCPAHHALLQGRWLSRRIPAQLARLTLGAYCWGCSCEPKPAACTCMAITRDRAVGSFRSSSSSSCAASCCRLSWKTVAHYCVLRTSRAALSQARTTLPPVLCLWCDLALCGLAGAAHTPAPSLGLTRELWPHTEFFIGL